MEENIYSEPTHRESYIDVDPYNIHTDNRGQIFIDDETYGQKSKDNIQDKDKKRCLYLAIICVLVLLIIIGVAVGVFFYLFQMSNQLRQVENPPQAVGALVVPTSQVQSQASTTGDGIATTKGSLIKDSVITTHRYDDETTKGSPIKVQDSTTQNNDEGSPPLTCSLVMRKDTDVGPVNSVTEDLRGALYVSGEYDLTKCNITTQRCQLITLPQHTSGAISAIYTRSDIMWAILRNSLSNLVLYSRNVVGTWQRHLQDDDLGQLVDIDLDSEGNKVIFDNRHPYKIHWISPDVPAEIVRTLHLNSIVELILPTKIALLHTGNIAVLDNNQGIVFIMDTTGKLLHKSLGAHLVDARDICRYNNNHFLVTDVGTKSIHLYTNDGQYVQTMCEGKLNEPRSISMTSTGHLVVGDGDSIKVFQLNHA